MDTARIIRVSAVVMRDADGRVLNVRKRGTASLMLPGGKPEPGETAAQAALREFSEEIGVVLDEEQLTPLGVFRAPAANEAGHVVEAAVFTHPLIAAVTTAAPRAEIEHLEWLDPTVSAPGIAPLNLDWVFPALLAADAGAAPA